MVTMKEIFESALISELRLPQAVTVESGTSLKEVSEIMSNGRFGSVPIVKDSKLIGIFTERDWLNRVLRRQVHLSQAVDDVMTPNPVTLTRFDGIWKAAELMGEGSFRHIPIVDKNGSPVSMVSVRDVLQYLAECFPEQFLAHPPDPKTITLQAESG